MAFNEFDGVDSSKLKSQIRGIRDEIGQIEADWVEWEDDSGTRCWDVGAEYLLSDLEQRQLLLKRELAKRYSSQPASKSRPANKQTDFTSQNVVFEK